MKLTILQEVLQQAIVDVQRGISSRPSLPILSCILLTAQKENTLSLAATDLNIGIQSTIAAEIEEAGVVAVPAKVFSDFIATLDAGSLSLELKENTLYVKNAFSKASFPCFPAADYPSFPTKEGQEISLPAEIFQQAVQSTAFASSVDDARPILTALLFSFGEELEVVGTDGFRLSTFSVPLSVTSLNKNILLPAKALNEVVRISTRKQVQTVGFTVSDKLRQAFFSFEGIEVLVRLIEGEFPPYQKIIPAEFSTQIVFSGSEFAQKLKTAVIFARESSGIVRLKLSGTELMISSSSSSLGSQETTLPVKLLTGGDMEIAFNAKYLVDFLQVFKPEEIWFGTNESLKPALFRPTGMEHYRYIIMPFRVNQ